MVVAAVCGPLLGLALAHLTFTSFALRLLIAGTTDPAVVAPWWGVGVLAVAFVAFVFVVVSVESAFRRRRGLSELLRAGAG